MFDTVKKYCLSFGKSHHLLRFVAGLSREGTIPLQSGRPGVGVLPRAPPHTRPRRRIPSFARSNSNSRGQQSLLSRPRKVKGKGGESWCSVGTKDSRLSREIRPARPKAKRVRGISVQKTHSASRGSREVVARKLRAPSPGSWVDRAASRFDDSTLLHVLLSIQLRGARLFALEASRRFPTRG